MPVFYDDRFVLPLPAAHRFPMQKYALLRDVVVAAGIATPSELRQPHAATDDEVYRAHNPAYLRQLVEGTLSSAAQRRIGFPWSPELLERERLVTGATIDACRAALAEGWAVNLAGGTHHAFRDHGSGYCVFNDIAVAALVLQHERLVKRVAVVDCDVHQGDGTAALLASNPNLFTFSIHGAKNFPFHKQQSDLDIALPDGADDAAYLAALADGLAAVLHRFRPELVIYVAGADPFVGDALGRLAVSMAGLAERDRYVLTACRDAGLPVAITMAGGYAPAIADIVAIHRRTVAIAAELWRSPALCTR